MFFKQKTVYEWRISDWSSDVCSSDLNEVAGGLGVLLDELRPAVEQQHRPPLPRAHGGPPGEAQAGAVPQDQDRGLHRRGKMGDTLPPCNSEASPFRPALLGNSTGSTPDERR